MVRTKSTIWSSGLGGRLDDDVDALAEHVEVEVGDQGGDLDQGIGPEVEAGHLTVDPHQSLVHRQSPYSGPLAALALRHGSGTPPRVGGVKEWIGLARAAGDRWRLDRRRAAQAPRPGEQRARRARLRPAARVDRPDRGLRAADPRGRRRPLPRARPADPGDGRACRRCCSWPSSSGSRRRGRAGWRSTAAASAAAAELDGASSKYPGEIARDVGLLLLSAVARRLAADPLVAGSRCLPDPLG